MLPRVDPDLFAEAMRAAYIDYGYDVVALSMASVDERVAFVLANR
ncbi:MAG: hypothetical protein ACRDPK_06215 [Carbonactinosporaceae bacterium]